MGTGEGNAWCQKIQVNVSEINMYIQARVVNHMKKVFSYILSLSQKGTSVLATDSGK